MGKLEDMMDDMQEMQEDQEELQEMLGRNYDVGNFDEEALMDELNELDEDIVNEQLGG